MTTIAYVSWTGAGGATLRAATLPPLLPRDGRPVVALYFFAQNLLGVQLGLFSFAPARIAPSLAGAHAAWHAHAWRRA
ncbi:cellulose synthase operon protein YhjQ, partial [Burkholderia pseudomallei]